MDKQNVHPYPILFEKKEQVTDTWNIAEHQTSKIN